MRYMTLSDKEFDSASHALIQNAVRVELRKEQRRFTALFVAAATLVPVSVSYSIRSERQSDIERKVIDQINERTLESREDVRRASEELQFWLGEFKNVKKEFDVFTKMLEDAGGEDAFDNLESLVQTMIEIMESREVDVRLAGLESVILRFQRNERRIRELKGTMNLLVDSPERSLALPLLQRDLENIGDNLERLEKSFDEDIVALEDDFSRDFGRIYDLGKWFIGLILAGSIVQFIQPFMFRARDKTPAEEPRTDGLQSGGGEA